MSVFGKAMFPSLDVTSTIEIDGDFVPSDGSVTNAKLITSPEIDRSKCAITKLAVFGVPLTQFRTYDDMNAVPTAASGDDLHIRGTFGSESAHFSAGGISGATNQRYLRTEIVMPPEYEAKGEVKVRIWAGMQSNACDTSCEVDVECYLNTRDGTSGGKDLCNTNAYDMNSTVFRSYDFTIDPNALVAGDRLDTQLNMNYVDANSSVVTEPTITAVELLCDIRL